MRKIVSVSDVPGNLVCTHEASVVHVTPSAKRLVPAWLPAVLLLGMTPISAWAHGDVHHQIEITSAKIEEAPTAEIYLKRGELHRLHGDYAAALEDYDRAAKLDPKLDVIWLSRGRTLHEAGRFKEARRSLDRFVKKHPDHADARVMRARNWVALKKHTKAVDDFTHYLANTAQPDPECFLEKAEALVALGEPESALATLDEGLERLGNLVVFQTAALELELQLKRFDAALARVDRVLPTLPRRETWQTRRGDVLAAAGRVEEAREAYHAALTSIESLPPHLRKIGPTQALETRLRQLVEEAES